MLCVCVCVEVEPAVVWLYYVLLMMRNDERPGNRVIPMRILMRESSSSSSPSCYMVYILVVIVMIYSLVLVVSDVWRRFRVIRTRPKTTMNPVYWMGRIRIRVSPPSALDVYELVSIDMHDELYDVMFPFVNHIPRVVVTISNLFAQPVQVTAAMIRE